MLFSILQSLAVKLKIMKLTIKITKTRIKLAIKYIPF